MTVLVSVMVAQNIYQSLLRVWVVSGIMILILETVFDSPWGILLQVVSLSRERS